MTHRILKRLILHLLRVRLRVSKYEEFQFDNQKSDAVYYFGDDGIMKYYNGLVTTSDVSLKWLLDDRCVIRKVCREVINA